MTDDDITAPTTLGPGRLPGGMPLKIRLGEAEYAALIRIAQQRHTTAPRLVEKLVEHALANTDVPPPAESHVTRPHTTYEAATQHYRRD